MRALATILLVLLFAPIVSAVRPPVGTEAEPELRDDENDVQYGATYLGPRDRGFIDISVAWFDYAPLTDQVQFNLRVPDARSLQNSPAEPDWRCITASNLTGADTRTGRLSIQWIKNFGSDTVTSSVLFSRGQGAGTEPARVDHRFSFIPETPGYFEWSIDRNTLLNLGDTVSDLAIRCTESEYVGNLPTGTRNLDEARSTQVYNVGNLERPEGPPDNEALLPTAESSNPGFQTDEATPALAALTALVALIGAVSLTRRRR